MIQIIVDRCIFYITVLLVEGERVALTTYKLEFYTNLPGYGLRGYIMTNMNNQIIKLEVYKSMYMFDTNGCDFIHVSFYLPTMTSGKNWNGGTRISRIYLNDDI